MADTVTRVINWRAFGGIIWRSARSLSARRRRGETQRRSIAS
jgi:hypothetical protein